MDLIRRSTYVFTSIIKPHFFVNILYTGLRSMHTVELDSINIYFMFIIIYNRVITLSPAATIFLKEKKHIFDKLTKNW